MPSPGGDFLDGDLVISHQRIEGGRWIVTARRGLVSFSVLMWLNTSCRPVKCSVCGKDGPRSDATSGVRGVPTFGFWHARDSDSKDVPGVYCGDGCFRPPCLAALRVRMEREGRVVSDEDV